MTTVEFIRRYVLVMSQRDLASALGVTQGTVSKIERHGLDVTSFKVIRRLRQLGAAAWGPQWRDELLFEVPEEYHGSQAEHAEEEIPRPKARSKPHA